MSRRNPESQARDHTLVLSYEPKPDITAYELAMMLLSSRATIVLTRDEYEDLPDGVRRHLNVVYEEGR